MICDPLFSEILAQTWLMRWIAGSYIFIQLITKTFLWKLPVLYDFWHKYYLSPNLCCVFAAILQRDDRCMCKRRPVHRKTNSTISETHFVIEHSDQYKYLLMCFSIICIYFFLIMRSRYYPDCFNGHQCVFCW